MLFRFGVVLIPESSDVEVFVLGSRAEMGHWDSSRAVQMKASQKLPSPHEPCLWVGDVQLAEPVREPIWFKFVKRLGGSFIWEGTHVSATSYIFCMWTSHIFNVEDNIFAGKIRKHLRHVWFILCNVSFPPRDGGKVTLGI